MDKQFETWWNEQPSAVRAPKTKLQFKAIFKAGWVAAAQQSVEACRDTKDQPDHFGKLDQLSQYGNTAVDCCIDAIEELFDSKADIYKMTG
jgi:hypothetical protein